MLYYDDLYRYACSLLRKGMKQIVITLDSPEIEALEKQGDKEAISKVHDRTADGSITCVVKILNSLIMLGFS